MEIRVEGRPKADVGALYQRANKQRYEIEAKLDAVEIAPTEPASDKLLIQTKGLLESFAQSLDALSSEIRSQPPAEQETWQTKLGKLKKYGTTMNSRHQKVTQMKSRTAGNGLFRAKRKGSDEEDSAVKNLVDEQDGLLQSQRIAMEIQSYGSLVWNSIKDQSRKLQVRLLFASLNLGRVYENGQDQRRHGCISQHGLLSLQEDQERLLHLHMSCRRHRPHHLPLFPLCQAHAILLTGRELVFLSHYHNATSHHYAAVVHMLLIGQVLVCDDFEC